MGYDALRRQYDPDGHLAGVDDATFLAFVADHNGQRVGGAKAPPQPQPLTADLFHVAAPDVAAPPNLTQSLGGAAIETGLRGTAGLVNSLVNMPRGFIVDPLVKTAQGLAAFPQGSEAVRRATTYTPEERQRLISATGGLLGLLTADLAVPAIAPLAKAAGMGPKAAATVTGAGSGALAGMNDAATRSLLQGNVDLPSIVGGTGAGLAGGAFLGRMFGTMDPRLSALYPRSANPFSAPLERLAALDTGAQAPAALGPVPFRAKPLDLPPSPAPVAPPVAEGTPDAFSRLRALGPPPTQPPTGAAQGPFDYLGMGPGRTLAHMARERTTEATTNAARAIENVHQSGLGDLSTADRILLSRMMQQGEQQAPRAITPRIGTSRAELEAERQAGSALTGGVAKAPVPSLPPVAWSDFENPEGARSALSAMQAELRPIIPAFRQAGGQAGEVGNFYPRVDAPLELLASPRSPVRRDVAQNLMAMGGAKNDAEAQQAIDALVRFRLQPNDADAAILHRTYEQAGVPATTDALRESLTARPDPLVPSLVFHRGEVPNLFYDPDPARAIPAYLEGAHHALASAQTFGPEMASAGQLGRHAEAQLARIADPVAQNLARHQLLAALGAAEAKDPGFATAGGAALRQGASTLMNPLSAMRNATQGPSGSLLTTDLPSLLKAYARIGDSYAQGRGAGAVGEHALQGFVGNLGGGSFTENYLKGIGMTGSENLNRATSSGSGIAYAQKMAQQLLSPNLNKRAFAEAELSRMGVRPEDIGPGGRLTPHGADRAAYTATRASQFVMDPGDLPSVLTASEPGRLAGQYKGFPILQAKLLARETVDRLRSPVPGDRARALRNLAILGTVYPLMGEASADTRAAAKNVLPVLLGKRPASKLFERSQPPKSVLDRILQNEQEMGGIGVLSDALQSLDYSPTEYATGPAIARASRIAQALSAASKGKANARNVRDLLPPGVGPFVQPFVDPRAVRRAQAE